MSRLIIVLTALLIVGCNPKSPTKTSTDNSAQSPKRANHVQRAKELFRSGDLDAAADAAYNALVIDPKNIDAALIASEVETARGNHQAAVELASSIDVRSRLGKRAVPIHAQQLVNLNRLSEAADVMLAGLDVIPEMTAWRHQTWDLLNRIGRRQEASQQAILLCRLAEVSFPELVSLLRRNDAFPMKIKNGVAPQKHFQGGLGMAKWHFTQRDYHRALDELADQYQEGFSTPAACALYGRLLAETQSLEQFPTWHAKCDDRTKDFSDYWGALGAYFFDQQEYEASAKALMEAVVRDPTDDLSIHRMARVFDALGRNDDAEQFRQRGITIAQMETDAMSLSEADGADSPVRKTLPRKLLELGRPFEALNWTLANLPPEAVGPRTQIGNQIIALSRDRKAIEMASEMSLVAIDPNLFSLKSAMEKLLQSSPRSIDSTPIDADPLATPRLVNVADTVGLSFQWYQDKEINLASIPIHEMMGGGIAMIDYDLDGWPDVYLSQGSGDPPTDACTRSSMLFRNIEARFVDTTSLADADDFNYSTGIAAGDVNQDGFADLWLGSLGHNRLLVNNGDGTFRDATDQLGDVTDQFTSSLAIADINADALPDLFEAVYLEMEGGFKLPAIGPDGREIQPAPGSFYAESDRWFQNIGDGSFRVRNITTEVAKPGTSLGVVVTDFNSDGTNEVFVGNDARPNHFLVQAGENRFRNTADALGIASGFGGDANACMGIATGDFNRDGTLDMHITNFLKESSNHYLQTNGGGFTDFAARYRIDSVSVPYIGFGTKALDIDRNGWLDLIVSNGHVFDRRHLGESFQMPPQFLINQGNRFQQVQVNDDSDYWDNAYLGRTVAMTDFDRDGSIDFLIGHFDQPLALLRNETRSPGHWIQLELVGTTSERDAIGARVVVTTPDQRVTGWVTAGDGYLCTDEPVIDLGLGNIDQIDEVQIFWPSGKTQSVKSPAVDHRYLVVEGEREIHQRH